MNIILVPYRREIRGQVIPCIKPSGNLDVTFSGGQGNDIVSMMIVSEWNNGNEGKLAASVFGGDGNDLLALLVKN